MIKRFFTAMVVPAFIFSCNSGTGKTENQPDGGVDKGIKKENNSGLIYLDTAKNVYDILCQDWVLKDDAEGLEGMDDNSKFEIPYRSYFFSANGSFVKNVRNTFDYGTWRFDDAAKTITINNEIERSKEIYKISKVTGNELVWVNTAAGGSGITFTASGKRFKNTNDEPFLLENNRWRIRPTATESAAAVHQRLKENIHFFILFYKSVLAKEEKIVSFWGLPSCFKWYGGGIFIKKENELKANWINCFYNKDQAMQAYALAEKLLEQKYTWPKGEQNWLKLNLAVLEQMYEKMDAVR